MKPKHAMGALLASTSLLACISVAAAADAAGPGEAPDPNWRTVVVHQVAAGEIGARYRRMHAAYLGWPDTDQGRSGYASRIEGFQAAPEFLFEDGYDPQNKWRFLPPAQGNWPSQALQLTEDSTEQGYHFTAHAWCESASECETLRDLAQNWPSPPPNGSARERANRQWQSIALNEPCEQGPLREPRQFPLPRDAAANSVGAFSIHVLLNPCGDVRYAWLATSSGNRKVDLAAMSAVRNARLAQRSTIAEIKFGAR